jgi:uncharacterized protein (DUF2141 family)
MSVLVIGALLMAIASQEGQTSPPPEATAAVRGRVFRADGRPLPRSRVRVMPVAPTSERPRTVEADLDGRYEFTGLRPGQYRLFASKAGYVGLELGQRRPREPGRAITLTSIDKRENVDIVLPRTSAIVGRIVDENGDPVQGASMRVLRSEFVRGRRRLVDAGAARLTDDRGQYRIYGLQPGRYVVSAIVGQILYPGPAVADLRGYATTYFPGTPNAADAAFTVVDVAQDVFGIDFALAPARTARVSGKAFTSTGDPIYGGIVLSPSQRSGGVAMQLGARTKPDGSFEFSNVAPGEYVLQVYRGRMNGSTEGEFASQFVTVNGADVPNLMMRTTPGSTITGRVRFVGGGSIKPSEIDVAPVPVDLDLAPLNGGAPIRAAIRGDWTFTMGGVSGPRRLRLLRAPASWTLQGVYVNGSDVTDTPVVFDAKSRALTDVEIVLTSNVTELMGGVTDARGEPASDYAAVVFSVDRDFRYAQSRFVRLARPEQDGAFRVRGLPPGDYYVAALSWVQGEEWQDPALLESLATRATRVTLTEGQHATAMPSLIVR